MVSPFVILQAAKLGSKMIGQYQAERDIAADRDRLGRRYPAGQAQRDRAGVASSQRQGEAQEEEQRRWEAGQGDRDAEQRYMEERTLSMQQDRQAAAEQRARLQQWDQLQSQRAAADRAGRSADEQRRRGTLTLEEQQELSLVQGTRMQQVVQKRIQGRWEQEHATESVARLTANIQGGVGTFLGLSEAVSGRMMQTLGKAQESGDIKKIQRAIDTVDEEMDRRQVAWDTFEEAAAEIQPLIGIALDAAKGADITGLLDSVTKEQWAWRQYNARDRVREWQRNWDTSNPWKERDDIKQILFFGTPGETDTLMDTEFRAPIQSMEVVPRGSSVPGIQGEPGPMIDNPATQVGDAVVPAGPPPTPPGPLPPGPTPPASVSEPSKPSGKGKQPKIPHGLMRAVSKLDEKATESDLKALFKKFKLPWTDANQAALIDVLGWGSK